MLWHQVLAGRLAGLGMGTLYGVGYSDMCAFRAIDRAALERLLMCEMTYGWNIEMQMKAARGALAHSRSADALPLPGGRSVEGCRVAARHDAGQH